MCQNQLEVCGKCVVPGLTVDLLNENPGGVKKHPMFDKLGDSKQIKD